ncbi:MAG: hypothetical protein II669_06100 [Elusimicrobia bacterium]|jgi:hypothetical protein|nr:hypothetical protein [Elusimicrobiota bacterium]
MKAINWIDIVVALILVFIVPGICYECGLKDTRIILLIAFIWFGLYKYIYKDKKK